MSAESKFALLGLHGSGKTTYLAALWHLVESNELSSALRAAQLQPDRAYLNAIRDKWIQFEEVGRTPSKSHNLVSLKLEQTNGDGALEVSIPDLAGESFFHQWAIRKATIKYSDFVSDLSGAILFIHSQKFEPLKRIKPPSGAAAAAESTSDAPAAFTPYSPALSPTQVQLVELLQLTGELRAARQSMRLAVVISAWDLTKNRFRPDGWLERKMPLLYQYLVANQRAMPFDIFGISALGGDLSEDRAQLEQESVPSRRIQVSDRSQPTPHHDLSLPLRFLLSK